MKHILFSLATGFILSCNSRTTEQVVSYNSDSNITRNDLPTADSTIKDEDIIQTIRNNVQTINNMNLLVETFDWSEPGCSEQGKISYYFNKDSIVKIVESGFIGDGGWTKEYYYYQGKYIFSFMQSIGGPAAMPVDTSEIREYVNSDTLVLLRRNNEAHTGIKQKWSSNSTEYRLLNAFKRKNFGEILCN